jgi:hypothetical protein
MSEDFDAPGPVDWLVVERRLIPVLDLLLLRKDADGSLEAFELSDLDDAEVAATAATGGTTAATAGTAGTTAETGRDALRMTAPSRRFTDRRMAHALETRRKV